MDISGWLIMSQKLNKEHPTFGMSQFVNRDDSDRAKAAYYENNCWKLENILMQIYFERGKDEFDIDRVISDYFKD